MKSGQFLEHCTLILPGKNAPLYIVSLYTVTFGYLTPTKKDSPYLTAKNLASLSNKINRDMTRECVKVWKGIIS